MFAILTLAAVLVGQAAPRATPYKAGDRVLIVRGLDGDGEVPATIAVIQGKEFVRVANPTRAKIVDGKSRKKGDMATIEVEVTEGPSKGAKVWTNAAADCLKRDVPGNSRAAKRQRAKILKTERLESPS